MKKKNLGKKFGQENCCQKNIGQKNVGPKKFLVSNNFAREKFVSKNIWWVKILVPCTVGHRVKWPVWLVGEGSNS